MTSIDTLESPQNDGLLCDDAGAWVEDKHNLVFLYDSLFSTGMKNKWEARVYIDLYSGPGIVKLRDTGKLLWGSPLLALQVKDQFDKYIFCENNPEYLDALRMRAQRISPKANIAFIAGDCNDDVEAICAQIPIDALNQIGVGVRFLSLEPLLAPLAKLPLEGISWVIVGGESGPHCRPMNPHWVREVRDQCIAAGVPFFFKQWGGVKKKLSGRTLDGRVWNDMPDLPTRRNQKTPRHALGGFPKLPILSPST